LRLSIPSSAAGTAPRWSKNAEFCVWAGSANDRLLTGRGILDAGKIHVGINDPPGVSVFSIISEVLRSDVLF
jgi:hypothetical protein